MGPITMINTPDLDNEIFKDMTGGITVARWMIQKTSPTEFGPIEKAFNWSNINVVEQNQALKEIIINQQQILAKLNILKKQVKKTRKIYKMTTQQLSQLHANPRPISMIVFTEVASDERRANHSET